MEAALMAYCKSVGGGGGGGASEESFAKGIGGSKEDHIAEKVAGEVLRSAGSQPSDEAGKESNTTLFEKWIYGTSAAAKEALKGKAAPPAGEYSKGRWIRTLNNQGTCYLYIHTSTYQMQGTRPEDFVDDGKQEEAEDPYENFPSCYKDDMDDAIAKLWKSGKVPLLLCCGDQGYDEVKKLLTSSPKNQLLDVAPFVKGVIATKIKFADHVETARKLAVQAMKAGGILVIDLSTIGSPNWKEKICQVEEYKKSFPIWVLDPNAHKEVDKHGQIFRKEEKKDVGDKDWDEALAESLPSFRIVYLCAFGPDNYEKNVQSEMLPQGKWSALRVKQEFDSKSINLKSLIDTLDSIIHEKGKIPVISDPTENTDTFFAFQNSNIIEMKSVIVAKSSQGLESALEKMRQKLVAALKSGSSHDQRRSVTCGKGTRLSSDCPTLLPTLKRTSPTSSFPQSSSTATWRRLRSRPKSKSTVDLEGRRAKVRRRRWNGG
uniref:Uncharacterized protein n=1 Tax=Guillardia theta TaxID=55529 RepID=A0A7S4U6F0_GUITH